MNKSIIRNKICYLLAGTAAAVMMLSACSSDEVEAIIKDETVKVSGTINNNSGTGLGGVTVKGIYSDNDPLNPSTTTATDGTFSLTLLKNIAVSLQASATNYVTLNSAKEALNADESGLEIDLPTTAEAQQVITDAFGAGPTLAGYAWVAVNVVDGSDNEVNGVTISVTGSPVDTAATDCNGNDSGDVVTIAPCPTRGGPMYFAYYDTNSAEVTVTAGADSQVAPVRRGEVTFLEFVQ